MTQGRHSEYKESYIAEADKYLATTGREQTNLPTIEGFSIWLDVSRESLYKWAKAHEDFADTLERILVEQKQQLLNDGIYGGKEINASIVKLVLMSNHGMRERSDVTSDGKELPTPIYGGKKQLNAVEPGEEAQID